ncbi:MAG: hypothetical protein KGS72_28080 [Cyanobacteria bacterium REEB67]|nr:hypothetical protein [Cyanobacteria bacterium REEB67]
MATSTDEPESSRWRFLYDADGPEGRKKAQEIKEIDQFWTDFKAYKSKITWDSMKKDPNQAVGWVSEHLKPIEPEFEFEMGPAPDNKIELDICRGSAFNRMPMLQTMVARAGDILGWKVDCYRKALDPLNVAGGFEARGHKKLGPFKAIVTEEQGHLISVTIDSPDFNKTVDTKDDVQSAFLLCELVLGEENLDKWTGNFHSKNSGIIEKSNQDVPKAAEIFAKDFTQLKSTILSKLPEKYYYQVPKVEAVSLFKSSKASWDEAHKLNRGRLTFVSSFNDLMGGLDVPGSLHSERYSRHGEKFAYLQMLDEQSQFDDEKRNQIEDTLDKTLREQKLGSLAATGRGVPNSYYFDLCLTDVDKAIPVLRSTCERLGVPQKCWLRFYDYYWRSEWVRMMPKTPALDRPTISW